MRNNKNNITLYKKLKDNNKSHMLEYIYIWDHKVALNEIIKGLILKEIINIFIENMQYPFLSKIRTFINEWANRINNLFYRET